MQEVKHDWTREEIKDIYNSPFLKLVHRASNVHAHYFKIGDVQVSTLLSVKTGGCSEDCSYCPQSVSNSAETDIHKLLDQETVLTKAKEAKDSGSTRFCMGAAWREIRDNSDFDKVLDMVEGVNEMGMEVCCTMGMLTDEQAKRLKDAGLYAYNHNIDTSEEYYDEVITTRTYGDRLKTIDNVRKNGISVCSGGIIGLGETVDDRVGMIFTLSTLKQHPESVPVNALVPVEGTPLEEQEKVSVWDMVRMIATARITMPKSMVRLSAGRTRMSDEEQSLCFLAGANSIFAGDKLLTTPNPEINKDKELFSLLGITPMASSKDEAPVC